MERVIGRHTGTEKGNLLIVTSAMHGNEPAGVEALKLVFEALEQEKSKNSAFVFRGRIIGMVGNWQAFQRKLRYIDSDLNRLWTPDRIAKIKNTPREKLIWSEEREIFDLIALFRQEIADYQPEKIYCLDLHTTSAEGGIFTVTPPSEEAEEIGLTLYAPLITGFTKLLEGTVMQFLNGNFEGTPSVSLTFESGQHDDKEAVISATSAIINTLRAIKMVRPEDVESKHDQRLKARAESLPKKVSVIYRHSIGVADNFKMKEGFKNFQPVTEGEVLAYDRRGEVLSPTDGLILMPLYQKLGDDGFFLVK